MKKQNLLLTGILTIAISCPAFATGIGASDTTADCDNSTLGTYEGETNLQAQWTANTIHLNWYNDSTENNGTAINVTGTNAASCEYDKGITLPSQPTKTGYEFAGWRVRPQQITCANGTYLVGSYCLTLAQAAASCEAGTFFNGIECVTCDSYENNLCVIGIWNDHGCPKFQTPEMCEYASDNWGYNGEDWDNTGYSVYRRASGICEWTTSNTCWSSNSG